MNNKTLVILAHLAFWLLIVVIYTWTFSHFLGTNYSLLRGLVSITSLVILVYGNTWNINHFFEKKKYYQALIVAIILFGITIPMRLYLYDLFPQIDLKEHITPDLKFNQRGVILTNILFLGMSSFYQILVNRYRKEREHILEIQAHQKAQLDYLKAQINPHFLFNTLNNIYALAIMKSDKTADMVVRLSNLLRYVVYDGREHTVSLKNEVDHIKEYIALFKMRSQPEPKIIFEHNNEWLDKKIEPMILIPLVENCLKHCDFDTNEKAYVRIRLNASKDNVYFETENTFDSDAVKDKVGGVGLSNIRKRLEMRYAQGHDLEIGEQDRIYTFKLALKYK